MTGPVRTGNAIDAVRDTTQARRRVQDELSEADGAWRSAIKRALAAGVPARTVAAEAGITPARIYQIANGRR